MKEITRIMIELYCIKELGYDFMGYEPIGNGMYSYHHLIIPKKKNGPESVDNGAVILRKPHDYLHTIEVYDRDVFEALTGEMIDMNIKGYLDIENIMKIDDILNNFEKEFSGSTTKKGNPIVKEEYTRRLVKKCETKIFMPY